MCLTAHTVAGAVERRPAWVFVLVVVGVAGFLGLRRRLHVARAARRAAAALDEAAREAAVVGGAGDLGTDVVAVAPDGRRIVVQCKHYSDPHRVGSQDLQRFGGTCFTVHEADVAGLVWSGLVTTTDFTAPALEYADRCGIVCVDREAL
ncbi:restriction endonuclease [Streptomyces sp. NBC_01314]|uniref:restriction endonuclease n=1 Tax=Streptomyces sp. NBC_01314 TaxID=2903821 RepID=UPI00352DDE6F